MKKISILFTLFPVFLILFIQFPSNSNVLEDVLFEAACNGNTERIKELLSLGIKIEINTEKKDEKNPLRCATSKNHYQTVELLLQNGADINHKDRFGRLRINNFS